MKESIARISYVLAGETPEDALAIIIQNTVLKHNYPLNHHGISAMASYLVRNDYCVDGGRGSPITIIKDPKGFMIIHDDIRIIAWNTISYWMKEDRSQLCYPDALVQIFQFLSLV